MFRKTILKSNINEIQNNYELRCVLFKVIYFAHIGQANELQIRTH